MLIEFGDLYGVLEMLRIGLVYVQISFYFLEGLEGIRYEREMFLFERVVFMGKIYILLINDSFREKIEREVFCFGSKYCYCCFQDGFLDLCFL